MKEKILKLLNSKNQSDRDVGKTLLFKHFPETRKFYTRFQYFPNWVADEEVQNLLGGKIKNVLDFSGYWQDLIKEYEREESDRQSNEMEL